MSQASYPLAPFALGDGRAYLVEGLSQAVAWDLASTDDLIPAILQPHPKSGGWLVRSGGRILALLPKEVREEYPDLSRVLGSGLWPSTVAEFVVDEQGSGVLDLEVMLPAPPFAVPRNNLPTAARLMPQGETYLVDTSVSDQIPDAELDLLGPAQLLLTLSAVGGQVVAVFGNRPLGSLRTSEEFVAQVHRAVQADAPLAVRAFLADGLIGVDFAAELAEAGTQLPELLVSVPEPDPAPAPTGVWELTLDGEDVSAATLPRGPRAVADPKQN